MKKKPLSGLMFTKKEDFIHPIYIKMPFNACWTITNLFIPYNIQTICINSKHQIVDIATLEANEAFYSPPKPYKYLIETPPGYNPFKAAKELKEQSP